MKKKILALCLAALMLSGILCGSALAASEPNAAVTGDFNGDGKVTALDLTLLCQYVKAGKAADAANDLNLDSVLDGNDVVLMQDYLAGTYTLFPKECSHGKYSVMEIGGKRYQVCDYCGFRQPLADLSGTKVAYIPIDNRPVNQERVQYLAQSVGIDLLMPEEDLYRTALDNMEKNKNGTQYGDREKLLQWLKDVDEECDYFIISLDQVISGGLVNSRWASNTDLTFEYEVADEIIHLCETNTVLLFDTVMRLASTVDYMGYQMDEYNALREYGRVARKTLTGGELTVDNIIAGYRYNSYGTKISTSLSEEAIEGYHASRARKLRIADYIFRSAGETMESVYIGVDDSSPQTTIQTNEINYLRSIMGEKAVLSAGADELGMSCMARLITLLYGQAKVNLKYYGPGKDQPADDYDIGTLSSTINTHLDFMNAVQSEDPNALQVLILTKKYTDADVKNLFATLQSNLAENIPTAVLDVTDDSSMKLGKLMFHTNTIPSAKILGFSSWNTASNATGISLSMAIARYLYLQTVPESTAEANEGFLKSLSFGYVKDLTYIFALHRANVEKILTYDGPCSAKQILNSMNASKIIVSLSPYKEASHGAVSISNPRYPWNRYFEATWDIKVG